MRSFVRGLGAAALLALTAAAPAVAIDWVTVGAPGNADDDTGFGAVAYVYQIAATEVTNAQYAEFLNAVAKADPNGLYHSSMGTSSSGGGISRSGSSGSYSYTPIAGRADVPVNYVSFHDALRYANWLHNGNPSGAQDATTTESGAYTITAQGISDNSITRNVDAKFSLTSEDEWYKAAYYDAFSTSYFDYPAESNTQTTCAAPGATPNTANCLNVVGDLTDVGSYTGSESPYGTFDQGGNVWEWTEAEVIGGFRVQRGGAYGFVPGDLEASIQRLGTPTDEVDWLGFRVAMVP